MRLRVEFRWFCILAAAVTLHAQSMAPSNNSSARKLAFLIPGFLQDTVQNAPAGIGTVFSQAITPNLNVSSLNSSVATALSNLPVPSPASALERELDPNLGVNVPYVQSLGPVYAERAETI